MNKEKNIFDPNETLLLVEELISGDYSATLLTDTQGFGQLMNPQVSKVVDPPNISGVKVVIEKLPGIEKRSLYVDFNEPKEVGAHDLANRPKPSPTSRLIIAEDHGKGGAKARVISFIVEPCESFNTHTYRLEIKGIYTPKNI